MWQKADLFKDSKINYHILSPALSMNLVGGIFVWGAGGRGYPDTVMPAAESSRAGGEVVDVGWRIWGRSTNIGYWRP